MKTRDIAAKYGIDRLLFEHFLKDDALPHQIGFLSVSVCDDMIKGNPNGYSATLGEMAFSEDANYLALRCPDSNFLLKRV